MLTVEQQKAFDEFIGTNFNGNPLGERYSTLVGLGVALALGCQVCVSHFLDQVDELGIGSAEVGAVAGISMCVKAGTVRNTLLEIAAERQ